MEIQKLSIADGILTIELDAGTGVDTVYIDSLDNYDNRYSANADDHTWSVSVTAYDNPITIDLTALEPEVDLSAFTVLVDGVLGFYYDEKELYNKEICLLTEFCSTCLDKAQKEREVLFIIKHELLKYAIENNLIEDQIAIYKDIARMLNIDVKLNALNIRNCRCIGKKCCNGCCPIC